MIMYSNNINFPAKHSQQWQDFVRQALEKKPHLRPTAAAMLEHPWIRCACRGPVFTHCLFHNSACSQLHLQVARRARRP
jgi:serine/threonine protein kinase